MWGKFKKKLFCEIVVFSDISTQSNLKEFCINGFEEVFLNTGTGLEPQQQQLHCLSYQLGPKYQESKPVRRFCSL